MTRMTGPDCVVMCNLRNTYIHTYIHSVPSTDVSQALAHLPGALLTGLVISPMLSSGKSLSALYSNISSEVLLC